MDWSSKIKHVILFPNFHAFPFVKELSEKLDLWGTAANKDPAIDKEYISKILASDHLQLVSPLLDIRVLVLKVKSNTFLAPPATDRNWKTLTLSVEAVHKLVNLVVKTAEWEILRAAVKT